MAKIPLLLEPEWLERHLKDPSLLIVDLCHPDRFAAAHIPGAVSVHPQAIQSGLPKNPGLLPNADQLQQLANRIGLTPERHVVVYDDEGGGWAGRFIWLLDCIGHARYSYLNGGWIAWHEEGRPLTDQLLPVVPSQYPLRLQSAPTASLQEVMEGLRQTDQVIWDARSRDEFTGARMTAAKAGHIPGARHFEWTQGMDPSRGMRMRSADELRAHLAELGITPDKRVITHCQTHHRSGFTYLIAKVLGYPRIKAYAGSWAEWGNHPDTPVVQGD